MIRRPPRSPLFPYPPLFRSYIGEVESCRAESGAVVVAAPVNERLDADAGNADRGNEAVLVTVLSAGNEPVQDRKSTRLNSSHLVISYAVFCLKKKNIRDRPR